MAEAAFAAIVLAAGKGTRMKSRVSKVLHAVAGRSMLAHVLACVEATGAGETVLVTSPDQDEVRVQATSWAASLTNAVQDEQRGTADAVQSARPHITASDRPVRVLFGDTPLLRPQTVLDVITGAGGEADIAVLGFHATDPTGYGRLLVDAAGHVQAIREELEATEQERAITLCNSGVIAFKSADLLNLLDQIGTDNAKGEYYLTDVIEIARANGLKTSVVECAEDEVAGVNSRAQLARAEVLMQHRLRLRAMDEGATLISPETVYLSADTKIAEDVTIEPHVFIGTGVAIGAGSVIRAFSHLEGAHIGEGASVGPHARLRPGAHLATGSRVGNFVEVKNAQIEAGAKVNHLTYIGDARVGQGANVGAGTITCNYDGEAKHFTDIGTGAFIGSNSSLVAPVSIGDGAYVGSGSVITKDVDAGALAVTRPKQLQKDGWAARKKGAAPDRNDKKSASGG